MIPPPCNHDDELVPGGGVSTLSGAPGTHHADGAGVGERKPAPSAQTPPPLPAARGKPADRSTRVGRDGGLDLILWAAVATALVITAVYAAVEVAHWPNVIGGG